MQARGAFSLNSQSARPPKQRVRTSGCATEDNMRSITVEMVSIILIAAGILGAASIPPYAFGQTMDLSHYTMTFNQDFKTPKALSVSDQGPITSNGPTWIAHTPYNGD